MAHGARLRLSREARSSMQYRVVTTDDATGQ
ncbi:hypothetical protein SFR_3682 [Streptomyces sp. FR-008]|nr:hypothetical protein SFR_3682 [Streptomyces sp. FR-008]